MYHHIFQHHIRNRIPELSPMVFVWDTQVKMISIVNDNEIVHSFTLIVRNLYPQLVFLVALDMNSFSVSLREIITINGSLLVADNVMLPHEDEYYGFTIYDIVKHRREEFSKLILTSQYKCVFCELEYDCGMPCIEIVADHVTMRCKASKVTGAD